MNQPLTFQFLPQTRQALLRVQAGMTLQQLHQMLATKQLPQPFIEERSRQDWKSYQQAGFVLEFPASPSEEEATIGGLLACDAVAGSPRCSRLPDFLHQITWIDPEGAVKQSDPQTPPPPCLQPQARGRTMLELLCGSEGSLGLITEATLLLQEKPAQTQGVWIQFDQLSQLFCFWRELSGQADSSPLLQQASVTFFDRSAFRFYQANAAQAAAPSRGGGHPEAYVLFFQLHLETEELFFQLLEQILAASQQAELPEEQILVTEDAGQLSCWEQLRHELLEATGQLRRLHPVYQADFQAASDRLELICGQLSRDLEPQNGLLFGHLLSGQLSAWLLPQQADDPAAKQLFAAWIDLLRRQGCGCSSEFGIGALKRPLLEQLEPEKAAAAYQLKQAIDPTMRLNPGLFAFSKGE